MDRIKEITFPKGCIKSSALNTDDGSTTLTVDIFEFMQPLWEDEHVNEFVSEPQVQEMLLSRVRDEDVLTILSNLNKRKEALDANHEKALHPDGCQEDPDALQEGEVVRRDR